MLDLLLRPNRLRSDDGARFGLNPVDGSVRISFPQLLKETEEEIHHAVSSSNAVIKMIDSWRATSKSTRSPKHTHTHTHIMNGDGFFIWSCPLFVLLFS